MRANQDVEFDLHIDEYLEAQHAIRMAVTKSAFVRHSFFFGSVFLFAGADLLLHDMGYWPVLLLVAGVVFLWSAGRLRRSTRKALRRNPELLGPFGASFSSAALSITSAGRVLQVPWQDLRGRELRSVFVIQGRRGEQAILPKWLFASEKFKAAQERIRAHLRLNVGFKERYPGVGSFAAKSVVVLIGLVLFAGDIDILARISALRFPTMPRLLTPRPASAARLRSEGKVFLIPLGGTTPLLNTDLTESFRTRYGIEMQVLPLVPLPDWARDPVRNQLIADELIETMLAAYPDKVRSGGVMIGVTTDDMYTPRYPSDYVMTYNQDDRTAVISTARLSQNDGRSTSGAVEQRFRKLVTHNFGHLYYTLIRRRPAYSVLYTAIRKPEDLDGMFDHLSEEDVVRSKRKQMPFLGDPCLVVHYHYSSRSDQHDRPFFSPCSSARPQPDVEVMEVDLRYGLLLDARTEFSFPDSIPLQFSRVVRNRDERSRAIGIGGNHNLNIFPVGDVFPFSWIDLVLEDGGRAKFRRTSLGYGYWDAFYKESTEGFYEFSEATLSWVWQGWRIKTNSGREYRFPPAYGGYPEQAALSEIRDGRHRLTLERNGRGHLLVARSPSGKQLRFIYDTQNRIQRIEADNKDWREYRYDPNGYLSDAIAPQQHTEFRREGRTLSIANEGELFFQAEFDESERIIEFRLPAGGIYKFKYPRDAETRGGPVTVTDSNGGVMQFDLTADGYTYRIVK